MSDTIELQIHIQNRTPDTMPADELADYLKIITSSIGTDKKVYFKEIRKGSACHVLVTEQQYSDHINKVFNSKDFSVKFNNALIKYGTHAHFQYADNENTKIEFLGINEHVKEMRTPIHDKTTLKGKITRIEGRDDTINIDLLEANGVSYACEVPISEARNMQIGDIIKVETEGYWIKKAGKWQKAPYKKLYVIRWEKSEMHPIREVVNAMHGIIGQETFEKIQHHLAIDRSDTE